MDYSRGQEFETDFLIELSKVFGKRLYVSVSRAKQRLSIVGDEEAFAMNKVLSQVPGELCTKVYSENKTDFVQCLLCKCIKFILSEDFSTS